MLQAASPNPSYDVLLRVCVFGAARVGKSAWVQRWEDPSKRFSDNYDVTIGVEFVTKTITNSPTTTVKHTQRSPSKNNNNKNHCASISSTGKMRYKLQVWDTAGQPKFESIVKSYIRGACCVFVCFDVNTSPSVSLEQQVPHYMKLFKDTGYDHTAGRIYLILVGLKADDKGDESQNKVQKIVPRAKTGARDDDDDDEDSHDTESKFLRAVASASSATKLISSGIVKFGHVGDDSNDDHSDGTRQVSRQEAENFASQNGFLCYCEVSAKANWNVAEPFQRLVDYVHLYGLPGASDSHPVPRPMPVPPTEDDEQGRTNSRKKWGYFPTFKQLFFIEEKKNKKYSSLHEQSKYGPL